MCTSHRTAFIDLILTCGHQKGNTALSGVKVDGRNNQAGDPISKVVIFILAGWIRECSIADIQEHILN